jgi:hypothetical protein
MLVCMNFQKDFEDMVAAKLKDAGYKNNPRLSASRAYGMIFDSERRQVPKRRYTVHVSPELLAQSEYSTYRTGIAEIIELLEKGESITHCLSKRSADIYSADRLLAYWGINHLHPVVGRRGGSFTRARARHLLYFRVDGDNMYFVDLLPHPPKGAKQEWINAHLVRVVDRNWPFLHVLHMPGPAGSQRLSDEEHKTLSSKNANALVATDRGAVMPSGGVMANGTSVDAVAQWMHLVRRIETLQSYVEQNQASLFPKVRGPVRTFHLVEVDGCHFHVLDGASRTTRVISMP